MGDGRRGCSRLWRGLAATIGVASTLLFPAISSAIDEFPLPAGTTPHRPGGITAGPLDSLWFTEEGTNGIGRVTTAGGYDFYGPLSNLASIPDQITVGPGDGRLWFTMISAGKVGRLDPATREIKEFPAGAGSPQGITAANGAIWYTAAGDNTVRQMQVDGSPGAVIPIPTPSSDPSDITVGPDGKLWFTEQATDRIGSVTPAPGSTPIEYDLTPDPSTPPVQPSGIISAGGALWFTESNANAIGQISTTGSYRHFPGTSTEPSAIETGRDGALWFTESPGQGITTLCPPPPGLHGVGRITSSGIITNQFQTPTALSEPSDITEGPDGALWFSEYCVDKIGRIATAAPAPPPPPPSPKVVALSVSSLKMSPSSFRAASSGASITAKKKGKTGTSVSYTLSTAATTRFTVEQPQRGQKRGKKCVKPKRGKKGKRCTRYVVLKSSFKHTGKAGSNKFRFSGRVGGKKLRPGKYRLVAVATSGTRKSKTKRANFKIVR